MDDKSEFTPAPVLLREWVGRDKKTKFRLVQTWPRLKVVLVVEASGTQDSMGVDRYHVVYSVGPTGTHQVLTAAPGLSVHDITSEIACLMWPEQFAAIDAPPPPKDVPRVVPAAAPEIPK